MSTGLQVVQSHVYYFAEKFKTGIKNYSTEFRPLTPEELQDLLKSQDHQMEMKGEDEQTAISDKDLKVMLDRSDLIDKWDMKSSGKTGMYCCIC